MGGRQSHPIDGVHVVAGNIIHSDGTMYNLQNIILAFCFYRMRNVILYPNTNVYDKDDANAEG